jgi:hypothetical protein
MFELFFDKVNNRKIDESDFWVLINGASQCIV